MLKPLVPIVVASMALSVSPFAADDAPYMRRCRAQMRNAGARPGTKVGMVPLMEARCPEPEPNGHHPGGAGCQANARAMQAAAGIFAFLMTVSLEDLECPEGASP